MVRRVGLEPTRPHGQRIFLLLRVTTAALCVVVWTIPSPCDIRLGARRLVSTRSYKGFARYCPIRSSTEFDAIHIGVSNLCAQIMQVRYVYLFHHPRMGRNFHFGLYSCDKTRV